LKDGEPVVIHKLWSEEVFSNLYVTWHDSNFLRKKLSMFLNHLKKVARFPILQMIAKPFIEEHLRANCVYFWSGTACACNFDWFTAVRISCYHVNISSFRLHDSVKNRVKFSSCKASFLTKTWWWHLKIIEIIICVVLIKLYLCAWWVYESYLAKLASVTPL